MATVEEATLPLDYKIDVLRKRYLLQLNDNGADSNVLEYDIESLLTKHDAAALYSNVCKALGRPENAARAQGLAAAAAAKLEELDRAIAEAEEQEGETEVRAALVAKAQYLADTGDAEAAAKAFEAAEAKTAGAGPKLDLALAEAGGDWERRNRLKLYEAVAAMGCRKFSAAADLLLDCLPTFSATELMSFEQCVCYAVISSPEVLSVIDSLPHVREFASALYESRYADFFRAFAGLLESLRTDCFLHAHSRYFQREVRVKVYSQFLESYKSVTLNSMAAAFGVSADFIDAEVAEFIVQGRVAAHIDRVAGVVQTARPDAKNGLYQQTIKQGDLLLARMQNLSRIIDLD
ncbi:hypothetical protein QBZ16_002312 [Prototheca wickerhamii]|uniref:PCI domain-containing protein n=1 Tax=Prototheca wickerhamii TaxID=3111 RepID=A0AAD9IP87_PROWI|nr:hypothetical protein QBZ16_002312 [Prototheca wickerhamii]